MNRHFDARDAMAVMRCNARLDADLGNDSLTADIWRRRSRTEWCIEHARRVMKGQYQRLPLRYYLPDPPLPLP